LYRGNYMALYKPSNLSDVAALHVTTFSPPLNGLQAFMEESLNAIKAAASNNIKKLIIDTRSNTGGYICLGFTLARFISNGLPGYTYPNYDLIESDYMKSAYGCEAFPASASFYNINHEPVVDGDWYTKNT
jgi:C-terminal processing protease CtpA/Prc